MEQQWTAGMASLVLMHPVLTQAWSLLATYWRLKAGSLARFSSCQQNRSVLNIYESLLCEWAVKQLSTPEHVMGLGRYCSLGWGLCVQVNRTETEQLRLGTNADSKGKSQWQKWKVTVKSLNRCMGDFAAATCCMAEEKFLCSCDKQLMWKLVFFKEIRIKSVLDALWVCAETCILAGVPNCHQPTDENTKKVRPV